MSLLFVSVGGAIDVHPTISRIVGNLRIFGSSDLRIFGSSDLRIFADNLAIDLDSITEKATTGWNPDGKSKVIAEADSRFSISGTFVVLLQGAQNFMCMRRTWFPTPVS
ncbi:hypothetical protein ACFORG_14885 [Lutimaribacter marinistellae]|uniref:Uncharacterized protein n=1 Tax=Lutimaribacter marinistellae TaxID=1820329 RepID=A0ABV7THG9_9RHOB